MGREPLEIGQRVRVRRITKEAAEGVIVRENTETQESEERKK